MGIVLVVDFLLCAACECSIYGSIRDDCDQSTGRCVCKPGIEGQKCQECRNGKMLGPGGCTGKRATRVSWHMQCEELASITVEGYVLSIVHLLYKVHHSPWNFNNKSSVSLSYKHFNLLGLSLRPLQHENWTFNL